MNRLTQLIKEINTVTLQPLLRKLIGWDEMVEMLETNSSLLNHVVDITELPQAKGVLRKVQLADTELLRIVTGILDDNHLTYWLDCGTLLGAVRHGRFIPWDDDLDIAMKREDFEKAIEVLPGVLQKMGIDCGAKPGHFWLNIWRAGCIMDIFAVDSVSEQRYANREKLVAAMFKYRRWYKKHRGRSPEYYHKAREKIFGSADAENPLWFHSLESDPDYNPRSNDIIFPLRKIKFEDYEFWAPNDCDAYLRGWDEHFMSFPKKMVIHHNGDKGKLIFNSVHNHVDMDELIGRLKSC